MTDCHWRFANHEHNIEQCLENGGGGAEED